MGTSSSSDNDSLMKADDPQLFEGYDFSVWHDEDCLRPFEAPNGISGGSKLCHACQSLFSGYKEREKGYKHYYRLSSLKTTARRGCQLCALVRSKVDRETEKHRPSDIMSLIFVIYQASSWDGETTFEIWFHFLRICKGARGGDVVWGIKTIDFLLSEGKSLRTPLAAARTFWRWTSTSDIFGILQMSVKQPSIATRLLLILSPKRIDVLQIDG